MRQDSRNNLSFNFFSQIESELNIDWRKNFRFHNYAVFFVSDLSEISYEGLYSYDDSPFGILVFNMKFYRYQIKFINIKSI